MQRPEELILERLPVLVSGIANTFAGVLAFIDDIQDFPKLDRIHHWQLGVLSIAIGATTIGYVVIDILRSLGYLKLGEVRFK